MKFHSALLFSLVLFSCTTSVSQFSTLEENETTEASDGNTKRGGDASGYTWEEVWKDESNPLREVRILWESGLKEKARDRFRRPDVTALKDGPLRAERSILWEKLFTEGYRGTDIGLKGEDISALLRDNDDIWAGTWTGGVVRISIPLGTHVVWDPGEPTKAIRTVNRIIRSGNEIWVLRYGALEKYELRTSEWRSEQKLPVKERLQDIQVVDRKIYLGTLGRGLWVQDGFTWRRLKYPGNMITKLEPGPQKTLLVGTADRGLYLLNPRSGEWIRPSSKKLGRMNITSITSSGKAVVGGTYGNGAFIWHRNKDKVDFFGKEKLGDSYVMAVVEQDGLFYYGTFGAGVSIQNPVKGSWKNLSLSEGFPSTDVVSLAVGSQGDVWAGTLGGGIIRILGALND